MGMKDTDIVWMQRALALAEKAMELGEVPVGALLVFEEEILGEGFNQPIQSSDPTAHAEIVALRQGGMKRQNYRLPNTTLYVTLEPCAMCAGALVHSRVERLVYATPDPRSGAAGSVLSIINHPQLNHQMKVTSGVLQEAASHLLKSFFQKKR